MPVTVYDSSAFRDLLPTKLSTFLKNLMWGGPVGGCFVLTPLKSRLAAAPRMVRAGINLFHELACYPVNNYKSIDFFLQKSEEKTKVYLMKGE